MGGYKPLIINTKGSFYKYVGVKNYFELTDYGLPLCVVEQIRHSLHLNWTVGNYIVLPVISEDAPDLDWLRRIQNWNSDKLFSVIENCYRGRDSGSYLEKVCLNNTLRVYPISGRPLQSLDEFIRSNFLGDYFNEYGEARSLYSEDEYNPYSSNYPLDKEDLLQRIDKYITIHDNLIHIRSICIIEILRSILEEDDSQC